MKKKDEPTLHEKLIARQSDAELKRKADKAWRKQNIWTREELDDSDREAEGLFIWLTGDA